MYKSGLEKALLSVDNCIKSVDDYVLSVMNMVGTDGFKSVMEDHIHLVPSNTTDGASGSNQYGGGTHSHGVPQIWTTETKGKDTGYAEIREIEDAPEIPSLAITLQSSGIIQTLDSIAGVGSKLYIDIKKFNNSTGSPFNEATRCKNIITSYISKFQTPVKHWSYYALCLSASSAVKTGLLEVKQVMLYYHDCLSRGLEYTNK